MLLGLASSLPVVRSVREKRVLAQAMPPVTNGVHASHGVARAAAQARQIFELLVRRAGARRAIGQDLREILR